MKFVNRWPVYYLILDCAPRPPGPTTVIQWAMIRFELIESGVIAHLTDAKRLSESADGQHWRHQHSDPLNNFMEQKIRSE